MSELDTFMALFVNRDDDFALQRPHGGYVRVGRFLSPIEVYRHLSGVQTIGAYVRNAQGSCSYAVYDADTENGLHLLREVQARLHQDGIMSYLEQSRRGAHLWLFFSTPVLASVVRAWLLPSCPVGVEFYPKQNEGKGYGSLIRLPLGVHRKSGKRYPFVAWNGEAFAPVATSVRSTLAWLGTIQRNTVGPQTCVTSKQAEEVGNRDTSFSLSGISRLSFRSIREWNAQYDPFTFIGRYVQLDRNGVGCCPFGGHHLGGQDRHASFKVYRPGVPGGYCWYCHSWQQGGSLFDFLRYYHHVEAATLWQELQNERAESSHTTVQVTRGVPNTLAGNQGARETEMLESWTDRTRNCDGSTVTERGR